MRKFLAVFLSLIIVQYANAQEYKANQFQQLDYMLRSPNAFRTASGKPGYKYWQQKADYKINLVLDDNKQVITGEEIIIYTNNSPDELVYLWIQLDQNIREKESFRKQISSSSIREKTSFRGYNYYMGTQEYDGGFKIQEVTDATGKKLTHIINYTMMRIDLPQALKPGDKFEFQIKWWYNVNERKIIGGRGGYEHFDENNNNLYTIAQFYPRMAVYSDFEGWQNKQFIGTGEFALTFGDYDVKITVPSDFIVGATGVLQNQTEVLSAEQIKRLEKAKTATNPVMIVDEKEARKKEKTKAKTQKTWHFAAKNVRDFAFAGSRKFIWDAMGVKSGTNEVMAMSFYPKEGNPLWEKYSTKAVAHTLEVYSHFTFDYPYPIAISVHTDRMGMEYPMICFNGGRPEKDGTYTERTKYGMIGVIIHEVGHNYFPMIVNSDERQWTWMDEGLNTFLQGVAEREWDRDWPSWRGDPRDIVEYMRTDPNSIAPIMSNSESILNTHANAYSKPATALNILRETVMGRELFDFAFKQYALTWMFKHPTPDDFFRIMEDASAVDLDWFWRAWFFTTDHVDIALENVKMQQINSQNPTKENAFLQKEEEKNPRHISYYRNKSRKTVVDKEPKYKDFYNSYNPYAVSPIDKTQYNKLLASLEQNEKNILNSEDYFTEITFKNIGGIVMPLLVEFTYSDNSKKLIRVPAEIWRKNNEKVTKVFKSNKAVTKITLDPYQETADTDLSNNSFPPEITYSKFEIYKQQNYPQQNPMQKAKK